MGRPLRLLAVLTAAFGASMLFAGGPVAQTTFYNRANGAICNPNWNGANYISYSQYGAYNSATGGSNVAVTCAVNLRDPRVNWVELTVYDRHSTQNVDCTVHVVDRFGNDESPPKSWSSAGYQTQAQTMTLFIAGYQAQAVVVECSIPPGGASFVTGISVAQPG